MNFLAYLDEVKARCERATDGPWNYENGSKQL